MWSCLGRGGGGEDGGDDDDDRKYFEVVDLRGGWQQQVGIAKKGTSGLRDKEDERVKNN